mmetsp:Transcript_7492/g.25537  ORF Transcript_7492/g.25537 Transcript_7492/m.25537 type:complete len:149 (-) Transcript_7492:44-490(-)
MGRAEAWGSCRAWVVANGGQVGPGLAFDAAHSGVMAGAAMEAGCAVLSIPLACCVSSNAVGASGVGREALAAASIAQLAGPHSASDLALAFFLAADARHPGSFYAPFYALLPQAGGTEEEDDPRALLPRSWTDEELVALLGAHSPPLH